MEPFIFRLEVDSVSRSTAERLRKEQIEKEQRIRPRRRPGI